MYIVTGSYIQPLSAVEPHMPTHGTWVKKYLDNGTFLFAGPKKSGLGGVIGVKSMDKVKLQEILAEDSYIQADVTEYQIVDFDCKLTQEDLKSLATS